jgi:hypothetical protein
MIYDIPNIDEVWLDIKDYEGYYQISNHGRIKRLQITINNSSTGSGFQTLKERIMRPWKTGPYDTISLSKDNIQETFLIHRLVAQHFISNPENKPEVNHKNGDPSVHNSNYSTNLEWATKSENSIHAVKFGLRENQRKAVSISNKIKIRHKKSVKCLETNTIYESTSEASRCTGINYDKIYRSIHEGIQVSGLTFTRNLCEV